MTPEEIKAMLAKLKPKVRRDARRTKLAQKLRDEQDARELEMMMMFKSPYPYPQRYRPSLERILEITYPEPEKPKVKPKGLLDAIRSWFD